jgi:hypothetical protein
MPAIIKTGLTPAFMDVHLASKLLGENDDCSVKAMSILLDIPYNDAHRVFAEHGRKDRKGTPTAVTRKAYDALGFTLTSVSLRDILDSYPSPHHLMKNVTSHQPRRFPEQWERFSEGRYLLHTRTHALPMRNGIVHCWSTNSALRVTDMWKVEPK